MYEAWIFGDPHFTTLDGLNYTFNGHGEYILLKDRAHGFEVQCRTKRAVTSGGHMSDATVFSAFAIQTSGAWLQAELNAQENGVYLYAGPDRSSWVDYTTDYDTGVFQTGEIDGVILERKNTTLNIVFTDTGKKGFSNKSKMCYANLTLTL